MKTKTPSRAPRRSIEGGRHTKLAHVAGGALFLGAAVVPTLALATGASASNAYCALGAQYQKAQAQALNLNPATVTTKNFSTEIKNEFNTMFALEPKVLAVAPAQLQANWKTVFGDLRTIYNGMAKLNFNLLKFSTTDGKSMVSVDKSLTTAAAPINAYDVKVCHLPS